MLAQEEARLLNHNYIGTEHILLGLIHEGKGVAAKSLESLGISLERTRDVVTEFVPEGGSPVTGHITHTPRCKKVLEWSLREALQLGHTYIGTEHLLLGLVREGEGVGAQVLVKLGTDLSRVRQQVLQLLTGSEKKAAGDSGEWVVVLRFRGRDAEHHAKQIFQGNAYYRASGPGWPREWDPEVISLPTHQGWEQRTVNRGEG